jgi:hypothetical protein
MKTGGEIARAYGTYDRRQAKPLPPTVIPWPNVLIVTNLRALPK